MVSIFLFILLITGVFNVIKDVLNLKESTEFKLGYSVAALLILGLFFWLNYKLFKFTLQKAEALKKK